MTMSYNVLNKTDTLKITAGTNQRIIYTYDAGGTLLRKDQYNNGGSLFKTTDYLDGVEYEGGVLNYLSMPEGRVLYISGSNILTPEYVISDQQGNARISFQDNGSGTAVVKQENSYYAFGLTMPNSPVSAPTIPNKLLYNGGSEWQNDYGNLPDLQLTFYRNYDAALGRFIGVDPKPESAESMTPYQYAGNNPVMMNDPLGDIAVAPGSAADMDARTPVRSYLDAIADAYDRIDYLKYFGPGSGTVRDGKTPHEGILGMAPSANKGDYSAFWSDFIAVTNDGIHNLHLDGGTVAQIYDVWSLLNDGDEFGVHFHDNGTVGVVSNNSIVNNILLPAVSVSSFYKNTLPSWWGHGEMFVDGSSGNQGSGAYRPDLSPDDWDRIKENWYDAVSKILMGGPTLVTTVAPLINPGLKTVMKEIGGKVALLGFGLDVLRYYQGGKGAPTGQKLILDGIMTGVGFTPFAPVSLIYFGVDAITPNFWQGTIDFFNDVAKENDRNKDDLLWHIR